MVLPYLPVSGLFWCDVTVVLCRDPLPASCSSLSHASRPQHSPAATEQHCSHVAWSLSSHILVCLHAGDVDVRGVLALLRAPDRTAAVASACTLLAIMLTPPATDAQGACSALYCVAAALRDFALCRVGLSILVQLRGFTVLNTIVTSSISSLEGACRGCSLPLLLARCSVV